MFDFRKLLPTTVLRLDHLWEFWEQQQLLQTATTESKGINRAPHRTIVPGAVVSCALQDNLQFYTHSYAENSTNLRCNIPRSNRFSPYAYALILFMVGCIVLCDSRSYSRRACCCCCSRHFLQCTIILMVREKRNPAKHGDGRPLLLYTYQEIKEWTCRAWHGAVG